MCVIEFFPTTGVSGILGIPIPDTPGLTSSKRMTKISSCLTLMDPTHQINNYTINMEHNGNRSTTTNSLLSDNTSFWTVNVSQQELAYTEGLSFLCLLPIPQGQSIYRAREMGYVTSPNFIHNFGALLGSQLHHQLGLWQ